MDKFIDTYLGLIGSEYKGLNLTRITNREEFKIKQYLDSIEPSLQCPKFQASILKSKVCVDVGFGGGFPLLVLAHANPAVQFIGLEARAKKVKAVNEIALKMNIPNVRCYHQRLEGVLFDRDACVTFKAVGKIPEFLKMFHVEQSTKIDVFFFKGPGVEEQEKLHEIDTKVWENYGKWKVEIPNTEARYLIGYKFKNVPRRTIQDKELVKLSSLI
jgi:16S rRNA (guanine527-N7)-methyltransferase